MVPVRWRVVSVVSFVLAGEGAWFVIAIEGRRRVWSWGGWEWEREVRKFYNGSRMIVVPILHHILTIATGCTRNKPTVDDKKPKINGCDYNLLHTVLYNLQNYQQPNPCPYCGYQKGKSSVLGNKCNVTLSLNLR